MEEIETGFKYDIYCPINLKIEEKSCFLFGLQDLKGLKYKKWLSDKNKNG